MSADPMTDPRSGGTPAAAPTLIAEARKDAAWHIVQADGLPPRYCLMAEFHRHYASTLTRLADALEAGALSGVAAWIRALPPDAIVQVVRAFEDAEWDVLALVEREVGHPFIGASLSRAEGAPDDELNLDNWTGPATDEELVRLNRATNATLTHEAYAAFQDTPAGKQAAYLIRRWRGIAVLPSSLRVPPAGPPDIA